MVDWIVNSVVKSITPEQVRCLLFLNLIKNILQEDSNLRCLKFPNLVFRTRAMIYNLYKDVTFLQIFAFLPF